LTALRKMTSTVLLKRRKNDGIAIYVWRRLCVFWRRWQPKLSKLRDCFFFVLVWELSDITSYLTVLIFILFFFSLLDRHFTVSKSLFTHVNQFLAGQIIHCHETPVDILPVLLTNYSWFSAINIYLLSLW
jgi:hypothetical protein